MFLCMTHFSLRLYQVLQRVIHGDYTFPSSIPVSDACKDLLSRILVVDPNKRIDIKGIQSHPW